jgi:hypothetical protein
LHAAKIGTWLRRTKPRARGGRTIRQEEDYQMIEILTIAAAIAATGFGYNRSRSFVRNRLRFVDAAHRRAAPWIAGTAAAVVAAPLVAVLPLVGAGTALLFGAGVGTGVAHGSRDVGTGRVE